MLSGNGQDFLETVDLSLLLFNNLFQVLSALLVTIDFKGNDFLVGLQFVVLHLYEFNIVLAYLGNSSVILIFDVLLLLYGNLLLNCQLLDLTLSHNCLRLQIFNQRPCRIEFPLETLDVEVELIYFHFVETDMVSV